MRLRQVFKYPILLILNFFDLEIKSKRIQYPVELSTDEIKLIEREREKSSFPFFAALNIILISKSKSYNVEYIEIGPQKSYIESLVRDCSKIIDNEMLTYFICENNKDFIPSINVDKLLIARLSTKDHDTTKFWLEKLMHLNPKVILFIEDYGRWSGTKKAVDKLNSEMNYGFISIFSHGKERILFQVK